MFYLLRFKFGISSWEMQVHTVIHPVSNFLPVRKKVWMFALKYSVIIL